MTVHCRTARARPRARGSSRVVSFLAASWLAITATGGSALAATPDPQLAAGVERCRQALRPQDDVGYARIAARCPELAAQLQGSSIAPWLPPGWNEPRNDLSAGGLAELLRLQQQLHDGARSNASTPQTARLRDLVADLNLQQAGHNSLWKRLRSALRRLFERQDGPAAAGGSFREWLNDHGISDNAWSIAQWVAMVLLGLLVLRVTWAELQALGWRRRLRAARQAAAGGGGTLPTPAQIDAAPLPLQPGMWLTLLADQLARRRVLRRAKALTAGELAQQAPASAAPLSGAPLREQLQLLAQVADPARFAAEPPATSLLQRAAAAGRALFDGVRGT